MMPCLEHTIVYVLFSLRNLLKDIKYVGHHDQVCKFYSHSNDYLYCTQSTTTVSGSKKKQNANKTFTAIPTIYQHIKTNKVSFGPTVCIFESAAKKSKFGKSFIKSLKELNLKTGFCDSQKTSFLDTSYNGWQLKANMVSSIEALKQKKYVIMCFDNWSHFKLNEFVQSLLENDIYPVYNVKNASGICGALDILPNKYVHSYYKDERKKMEVSNPKLTVTATGKFKALDRAHIAKVMSNIMKN